MIVIWCEDTDHDKEFSVIVNNDLTIDESEFEMQVSNRVALFLEQASGATNVVLGSRKHHVGDPWSRIWEYFFLKYSVMHLSSSDHKL